MNQKLFVFIDESGNPDFFGKRKKPLWLQDNFSPILIMGMLVTKDRRKLRKIVEDFHQRILNDDLYNTIHSVKKRNWFLHAKDDHPEVRIQFIELIRQLDFIDSYIVIARKDPDTFIKKHNGNAKEFYFDILKSMLEQLDFQKNSEYQLYLARRQSDSIKPFTEAAKNAISNVQREESRDSIKFKCDLVYSKDYPEMSVIDYLLWTVQRYILKEERRYFSALEDKFKILFDIYGEDVEGNIFSKERPFILEKVKPFKK